MASPDPESNPTPPITNGADSGSNRTPLHDISDCFGWAYNESDVKCQACTENVKCKANTAVCDSYAKFDNINMPSKQRVGKANGRYQHGGYCLDLMTEDERKMFEDDVAEYTQTYAYLADDPILLDLLYEYEIMKIRLRRIRAFLLDPDTNEGAKVGADKLSDSLRRTMSLYATRMGITYVSRARMKDKLTKRSPFDIANETDER